MLALKREAEGPKLRRGQLGAGKVEERGTLGKGADLGRYGTECVVTPLIKMHLSRTHWRLEG